MQQVALQELSFQKSAHNYVFYRGYVHHFLIDVYNVQDHFNLRVSEIDVDRVSLDCVADLHLAYGNW